MDRALKVFAGLPLALTGFRSVLPSARLYTLTPSSDLAVLPFDDDLQDSLHDRFGTGDWPESQAIALSTTDQAFAAECSRAAPLAFLQISEDNGFAVQSSAVWQMGSLTIGPMSLDLSANRPVPAVSLRPINVALRTLGVKSTPGRDELATFGLGDYICNDDIHARAWPLRL